MKKVSIIRSISAIFGIIAVLLLILSGCKSAKQDKVGETTLDLDEKGKDELIEELSGYPLPSAYEITEFAYRAGAPYLLELSNQPGKAEEYILRHGLYK